MLRSVRRVSGEVRDEEGQLGGQRQSGERAPLDVSTRCEEVQREAQTSSLRALRVCAVELLMLPEDCECVCDARDTCVLHGMQG